jgi:hypothetical protein
MWLQALCGTLEPEILPLLGVSARAGLHVLVLPSVGHGVEVGKRDLSSSFPLEIRCESVGVVLADSSSSPR